jgi:hypothetical protein
MVEFRGKAELAYIRSMILLSEVDHDHIMFKIININVSYLEKRMKEKIILIKTNIAMIALMYLSGA